MTEPLTPTYILALQELAAVQACIAHLRHLETQLLRLMHEAGITDDQIGIVQGISSQAVGQKRKRSAPDNNG